MNKSQTDFLLTLGLIVAFVCVPSAAQLTITQPMNTSTAPEFGNYRLAKGRDPDSPPPPLPCIPTALIALKLPVYPLGGDYFLIDDSTVDYAAIDEAAQVDTVLSTASNDSLLSYPPGSLWLALAMTNDATYGNMAAVTLNGTTNVAWYDILSKRSLTDPGWWSEGSLQGLDHQASSQASVTADSSASNVFLWVRALTNGSGGTLPIWWQLQNFGRTGLDPNSDPSGQGLSLLESYLGGTEPNLITFSVTATNNYANASPTMVQLGITGGVPLYQAVLVDSTNYAGAAWSAYTSTNLSVNLGSAEGWHDVWVGLRGFSASSYQTWEWKRLKLDRTPPQLSLLSPAAGVVTQPTIQLVGSCAEALSSIWYDLSNSTGLLSNQQVLILDHYQNTNTWEFTTNTFQAFDVQLSGGTNFITLHATDLAGNQTVTSFTFILDYSHKTNPPDIQLTWPQNGVQIGAGSFTLRGWTGDPTATVRAQVAGTNGIPHTFFGLVERTGKFWVDNISLAGGTNVVALIITDAARNSSSTNISVIQSAVRLTMNPVTPASQLWQPTVNVSGTISDPSYAVWVNGVKANNPSNGTWAATNVPVTQGGAAVFQMTGYSPDEQQPDGSHGN
jgi:hypothetical protein